MSTTGITKKPLKYVEIAINKFKDEAVPHYEKLLATHRNIVQEVKGNPVKMPAEQANLKRTEAQIKVLLYELDTLRAQVQDSDLDKFDMQTVSLRKTLLKLISNYKELIKQSVEINVSMQPDNEQSEESSSNSQKPIQLEIALNLDELKLKDKEACLKNVESIENDIQDFHEICGDLHKMVNQQSEHVDKIESNVEDAQINVNVGFKHLKQTSRLNAAVYPVAGAVAGTCIGGPVGFIAGLKFGGLAALACALLGYSGGILLKKHNLHTDIELPDTTSQDANNENKENKKRE